MRTRTPLAQIRIPLLENTQARSRYPHKSTCPYCNFTCPALRTTLALPSQARSRHPRGSESPCWTYQPGEISAPSRIRTPCLDIQVSRDLGTLADPTLPAASASQVRSRHPQAPLRKSESPCSYCNFTCSALRKTFALPNQARSRHPRGSESPCWTYQPGEISAPSRIRISLFGNTSQTTSPNLLQ